MILMKQELFNIQCIIRRTCCIYIKEDFQSQRDHNEEKQHKKPAK